MRYEDFENGHKIDEIRAAYFGDNIPSPEEVEAANRTARDADLYYDLCVPSPDELAAAECAAIDADYYDSLMPLPAELYAAECAALDADFDDEPFILEQADLADHAAAGQSSQESLPPRVEVGDKPAADGELREMAVRALKKAADGVASKSPQPDFEITASGIRCAERTTAASSDELVTKPLLTEHERQVLKEERKRKSALKQQREEEAARKQLEEDERNKAIRAASEAERIANSPFARTLERLLKLTAKSDEDRFVHVCHEIIVDQYLCESDKSEMLAQYVQQRPFGPSIDENRIANGLADAQRRLEAWKAALDAGMLRPSQLATARSEFAELIPGVIPAAQVGTISAPKNNLKTKIAVDLSVSLASGTDFLDCFPVAQPVHCGIIAAEDSEGEVRAAIERICHAKRIDPRSLDGKLWVGPYVPALCSDNWLNNIQRFIELNELKNLVIEAPYLGLDGADQRSLSAMGNALAPLKRLCDETGCAIQFAVHHKQANGMGWPALSDISGVGYEELSRYWLAINSRRGWNPATGEHQLRLMIGNKHREDRFHLDVREGNVHDSDGQIWEVNVSKPGEVASEEQRGRRPQRSPATDQLAKYQEKVLLLLQQHPSGLTMTAIGKLGEVPEKRRTKVIADLLAGEQIEETSVKVSNHKTPQKGYKLRKSP